MIHPDSPSQRKKSPFSSLSHLLQTTVHLSRTVLPLILPLHQPLSFPPFHSLSLLFKCCASWIPAVQSASVGEIEFTYNLVLIPFICVICLLEVWPPSSLLISEMYSLYFSKNCTILKRGIVSLQQTSPGRKPLHETKVLFLNGLFNGLQMSFNSTHKNWVTSHLQVHFAVCASSLGCQICVEVAK